MSNPSPYSVTARAMVKVTDLDALVTQIDRLVKLSPKIEPIEDGTYRDGWERREGSFVHLDDDPRDMVRFALGLLHLGAKGIDVEADGWVVDDSGSSFEIELQVGECEVVGPQSAADWLGELEGSSATILQARVAVRLLETLAGAEARVISLVAERADVEPGLTLDAPQCEITLVPGVPVEESDLPPAHQRIVVTDGGRHYETDENGYLVNRPAGYPANRSGRRPLRFDGDTARTVVHFLHFIPITRGFAMAWVLDNAPGWDANGLFGALGSAGLIEQPPSAGMPRLVDGVGWVDIEPSGISSRIEFDSTAFR
ncbi:hypothetical protein [Rhabdothermincola salaria]|uniref:hypothetical protein n=1 Tax=Rhabdothermincola salaria TaxID=2903142 RepID=UPI001E3DC631|nr:hypothetical protein [Rhabdothermincola salaria]MCD9625271.1 hypothetical protein [Rhabdothermincola salaria]